MPIALTIRQDQSRAEIIPEFTFFFDAANCITGNVTMGSIVASGKMLLTDRRKSQSEEQHDEPEKQA